jgi:hypothetical protein
MNNQYASVIRKLSNRRGRGDKSPAENAEKFCQVLFHYLNLSLNLNLNQNCGKLRKIAEITASQFLCLA